jgi:hypothetical protein
MQPPKAEDRKQSNRALRRSAASAACLLLFWAE